MAAKNNLGRVGTLEKEMEEVKIKLERLAEMEKVMASLTQGFGKILAILEETNRSVQSIGKSVPVNDIQPEKDKQNEAPREKTPVEDGKTGELKKVGAGGSGGPRTKVSDERIIIFQFTQSAKQLKARRKVPSEAEMLREMLMLDEPFVGLPSYPNFGPKEKLMKLKGRIKQKEVVVLIKSDATHNFVSERLVEELRLPRLTTRDYIVIMDDYGAEGDSICMYVSLEMPGMTAVEHFLPFDLVDSVDVILGTKWLHTLDDVMIYYEDGLCKMKIKEGNEVIEWETDPNL